MKPMGNLKIFSKNEKDQLVGQLNKQFGVKDIKGLFLRRGAERVFLYTGDLDTKGILEVERTIPVERIGVYFGKFVNDQFRLSIEGSQILQGQVSKGVFELDDEQVDTWMSGSEVNVETGFNGFLIMKYKDDFLGCGKASALKIGNFIPKNRRLKLKN